MVKVIWYKFSLLPVHIEHGRELKLVVDLFRSPQRLVKLKS